MGTDARIPGGYVLLSRALMDARLWGCGPDALRVATYLLLMARHQDSPHGFDGFDVRRGELVTSCAKIAEDTEWHENRRMRRYSRQKTQRLLDQLERIGFCARKSDTYGTHLTICNYEAYQNADNYKLDTHETTSGTTRTTSGTFNKGENENKGKNSPHRSKQKSGRVSENTPLMIRIGSWFGRRPDTLWTRDEAQRLDRLQLDDRPEEVDGMESYYTADMPGDRDYRRHDVKTLLNNWTGELDRARTHYREKNQGPAMPEYTG